MFHGLGRVRGFYLKLQQFQNKSLFASRRRATRKGGCWSGRDAPVTGLRSRLGCPMEAVDDARSYR
jgi:hypothetical protein